MLARLYAEVLTRWGVRPCGLCNGQIPSLWRRAPSCVVPTISLESGGERRYGVERRGGLNWKDIGVESIEQEGVEDLENDVHRTGKLVCVLVLDRSTYPQLLLVVRVVKLPADGLPWRLVFVFVLASWDDQMQSLKWLLTVRSSR